MNVKLNEQNMKVFVLTIIPFFIFVSLDGIFSIQSILLPIGLVLFIDLICKKRSITKEFLVVFFLFFTSSIVSLLINIFFNDLTTSLSIIRIIYYSIVIYFYFTLTDFTIPKDQLKKIIIANIICGFIVSLYLIFINHIWFVSFFNNRVDKNFVGAILAIQTELALIAFIDKKRLLSKIIYLFLYLVMLVGIFFTASRASILSCLFGTFLIIFFKYFNNVKIKKNLYKISLIIFILLLFYFFSSRFISFNISKFSYQIQWYFNRYFVNGFGDTSVTGRVVWWREAFSLWLSRPFCGYGIGNITVSGNSSAVSHNTYLDFLVDQGIVGFIAFLLIQKRTFVNIIKAKKRIFYGIILTLLFNALILSATRSVFLWYNLILLYHLENEFSKDVIPRNKEFKNEIDKENNC